MDATYSPRPSAPYEQPQASAATYVAMLRRHWWLGLLSVTVGVAGAIAYTDTQPREYVSTASVLVFPAGQDANVAGGRTKGDINLDTEAQLVRSTAVVSGAAKLLDETAQKQASTDTTAPGQPTTAPGTPSVDPEELGTNVSVQVPANTSVLQITFAAGTPEQAQAGARAFARSYLSNREGNAKAELAGQASVLKTKLKELTRDLEQINIEIAGFRPTSSVYTTLDSRRDTVQSQINQLNNKINQLGTERVSGGDIISEPRLPSAPVKPRVELNLAAGALFGLLLGVALAALRDRLDRRVRNAADLRDIGVIGEVTAKAAPRCDDVFAPFSEGGRCFNRLRNEVVAALNPGEQVVVVTGASRGPAATLVAANLAAALARTGTEVILVGAHLPDSMAGSSAPLARLLGVTPVPGLSEVLASKVSVSEAIQRAARVPSLHVITTGGTATAAGLLQSQSLRDIVATLRRRAVYVVIEAPSTSSGADAQSLASLADVAILAVELRRTKRPELADAAEQLRRVGTPLLGAVLMPRLSHSALAVDSTGDIESDSAEPDPIGETPAEETGPIGAENGHKNIPVEEQTALLAPLDAAALAELDQAQGR